MAKSGKQQNIFKMIRQLGRSPGAPGPPVIGRNPADMRIRLPVAGVRGLQNATAGTLATAIQVNPSADVPNWASLQGEFDEYRILGARLLVVGTGNTLGVMAVWTDENDNTTPSPTEANQRPHRLVSLSSAKGSDRVAPGGCVLTWRAQNYTDLSFIPMSTGTTVPCAFKLYTDTANYAANTAAQIYTEMWYDIEFRGIGGDA